MTEQELRDLLAEYLGLLQRHPSAEEMMAAVLTENFETGFLDGVRWTGLEGLRDFLSQREGFFDERHEVKDVLESDSPSPDEVHARTRLEFFLRRWEAPSPTSDEFTGLLPHLATAPGTRPLARSRRDRRALRRPQRELEAALRDARGGPQPLREHALT